MGCSPMQVSVGIEQFLGWTDSPVHCRTFSTPGSCPLNVSGSPVSISKTTKNIPTIEKKKKRSFIGAEMPPLRTTFNMNGAESQIPGVSRRSQPLDLGKGSRSLPGFLVGQ